MPLSFFRSAAINLYLKGMVNFMLPKHIYDVITDKMNNTANLFTSSDGSKCTFELEEDCPMSIFTSFKTGGLAAGALFPSDTESLKNLIIKLNFHNIPYYIVGNGTNLLVDDAGYHSVVIFTSRLKEMTVKENKIYVECGANITQLAWFACKHGLSGLEFAYGIPGSVGGAVYMNAGAYDGEMKNVVESSESITKDGTLIKLCGEEQRFDYRSSIYKTNGNIITGCTFALEDGDPEVSCEKAMELMKRRREKQPLNYPSAGSTFKRAPRHFTGKLIEDCGLKGYRIGDAMVSPKHAGFIVNCGAATTRDILDLIKYVKLTVFERMGVQLECEVKYLSRYGEETI